jgi:hypothetical protein
MRVKGQRVLLEKLIDPVQAFALYHYLDAHGVAVSLVDPPLRVALGEIPYLEVPVTLFLEDPAQLRRARELIRRFREGPGPVRGVVWRCPDCGEEHEPEFGSCWRCGATRP